MSERREGLERRLLVAAEGDGSGWPRANAQPPCGPSPWSGTG